MKPKHLVKIRKKLAENDVRTWRWVESNLYFYCRSKRPDEVVQQALILLNSALTQPSLKGIWYLPLDFAFKALLKMARWGVFRYNKILNYVEYIDSFAGLQPQNYERLYAAVQQLPIRSRILVEKRHSLTSGKKCKKWKVVCREMKIKHDKRRTMYREALEKLRKLLEIC